MRKWKKSLIISLMTLILVLNQVTLMGAEEIPAAFRELTVDEIVDEMGMGINLGNTFDGHTGLEPNETLWQNVKTSQKYITSVHDLGFNTIRIPVTWGTMIKDDYSIDSEWISRVQDVVDYAVSEGMYVIINVHHDGAEQMGWLLVESDNPNQVLAKFTGVWKSIATYFKDYDEHLIFESMNEVWGHSQTVLEDMEMINKLNQQFVNTVRETGGNNDKRWLSVPGRYTNIDVNTDPANGFEVPNDSIDDRIFVSVHDYPMGMGLTQSMGATEYSETMAGNFANKIQKLIDAYTSKGIPVILGEYGTMNKNNTIEREYYYEVVNRFCAAGGIVPVAWDNGSYDLDMDPDYSMALVDRESGEPVYTSIIQGMLRGTYSGAENLSLEEVTKPTLENKGYLKKIEEIQFSENNYELIIGERHTLDLNVQPTDADEIIQWSTKDRNIVNVSAGVIEAVGIGETLIYAYTQEGDVREAINVVVTPKLSDIPCESIVVNKSLVVTEGSQKNLFASNGTQGSTDGLLYRSLDERVASVNAFGKVVGIEAGTCEIEIQAVSGLKKTVEVRVIEKEVISDITIGINVYYNDAELNYFGNETGQEIMINGDGLYKLTFNTGENVKEAGVKGLNNVGAIYIKDVKSSTVLESCDILYREITLDGRPLTILQEEAKSALKDSGIFDTNDPINAWDGSQVDEVIWNQDNYTVNFDGSDNPQVIEVVFELSNVVFKGSDKAAGPGSMNLYLRDEDSDVEDSNEDQEQVNEETDEVKGQETADNTEDIVDEGKEEEPIESQDNNGASIVIIALLAGITVLLAGVIILKKK